MRKIIVIKIEFEALGVERIAYSDNMDFDLDAILKVLQTINGTAHLRAVSTDLVTHQEFRANDIQMISRAHQRSSKITSNMKSKYSAYFALEKRINSAGGNINRADAISSFTSGQKESFNELTTTEYREFLAWLNRTFPTRQTTWQESPENRMRRKVIALFCKLNFKQNGKADMRRINQWCCIYGRFKKVLNAHSYEELILLTSQVEKVFASYLEQL